MPVVSITRAFFGTATLAAAPTAVIFPPSITTAPFSITPWLMVRSFPPRRTMAVASVILMAGLDWAGLPVCASNGSANSTQEVSDDIFCKVFISARPHRHQHHRYLHRRDPRSDHRA